jgi:Na+/H+ antiporter NhaD/arsenite permease-like protein
MFLFIKRFLCSNFFSNTISIILLKLGKTEKIIKVQELAEIFSISVFFILIFVIANIFSKATFFSEYYNLYTKTWEKQKKKIK